jgi:hypothetical protein
MLPHLAMQKKNSRQVARRSAALKIFFSEQPTDQINFVKELFDEFDARLCSSFDPRHTIADVQKVCCIF